jgi:hypothetical protein
MFNSEVLEYLILFHYLMSDKLNVTSFIFMFSSNNSSLSGLKEQFFEHIKNTKLEKDVDALKIIFNQVNYTDKEIKLGEENHFPFSDLSSILSQIFPEIPYEIIISTYSIEFQDEPRVFSESKLITCKIIKTVEVFSDYEKLPVFFPIVFDGYMIKSNKNSFRGTWVDHKIKKGTLLKDGNKMMGEFKDFELDGRGYMVEVNGTEHLGIFKNSKLNGFGRISFLNGTWYRGTFLNGLLEGTCIADCVIEYQEGEYHEDLLHGYGESWKSKTDGTVGEHLYNSEDGICILLN